MDASRSLLAAARRLGARGSGLPPLLFFTDPARTPDPLAVAERLPRGSGVVFRTFGARDALETGRRLRAATRRRGLVLLVGADPQLAAAIGADGVHLPERLARQASRIRRVRPGWLVTAAAHGHAAAVMARRSGAHAVVISPVFASASPSAGRPLGVVRFAALVRAAGLPVYALGGVNGRTAMRLAGSGACGIAAVEALASES
ncbi:MAG: thiamine phosphate synthase [Phenylobacterium sp.]